MLDQNLIAYLYEKLPKRTNLFQEIEQLAKDNHVPIMDPYSMETVLQILRIFQPTKILEIGTAIGYSALRMSDATNAQIVTIERDEERIKTAEAYIEKANKSDQIVLLKGDAFDLLNEVRTHGPFDCLFIDAAKGQYKRFFENFTPFLSNRSLIITDNVLFKGFVYEYETENKRLQKLGKKINQFNDWLINHPDYHTVILPVGDGIAITVKKVNEKG
ncbi:O-methyltransferase [Caldibacillus thermolactis]|jgi:predicted O-methyltransferase YrrM|uniref:tRNA 5-hydroxyuridine methyltransferase n=1 Tax=Pallidibacillus thermolactis TaxID=251051 RepID=A0ABT2WB80_9BACI|nr:O-methyltransferase [Pallidibacillus thermolactis]MCU9592928.1 O-methyltransferase [Pallidibacillus thermolactis]MCU9600603.1 O-methyltransferase [Pallidibacillus thermolactis subsp. kokeshiiformis]MED1672463.1 O-methyltransferase [Pallidibacillus thermolactis subsp. kokeshiiformis]